MVDKLKAIWMDGKLVPWDDARIHVLTHTLHYGLGAFEGIRAYKLADGKSGVYRLKDHVRRLYDSVHIMGFEIPFKPDEIVDACLQTLIANGLEEGYIRPLVYLGEGTMGVYPASNPVRVFVATWKWGAYLGEDAIKKGVRAKISSFTRYQPNSMMTRAKLTGNYTGSVLAKREAKQLGFDEAILLDPEGYVAEGSGENLFIVRNRKIKTTPLSVILPGITRDTVMALARDLGYEVQESRFSRDEMYIADEAFFTGTAAEVTPIREVDGRRIGTGAPGPVTVDLQTTYFNVIRGRLPQYASWITPYDLKPSRDKKTVRREAAKT